MMSVDAAEPSSAAQLAAFEAIRLRCTAAADRVVAQAAAITEGEMHAATVRTDSTAVARVGDRNEPECDEVHGWLR